MTTEPEINADEIVRRLNSFLSNDIGGVPYAALALAKTGDKRALSTLMVIIDEGGCEQHKKRYRNPEHYSYGGYRGHVIGICKALWCLGDPKGIEIAKKRLQDLIEENIKHEVDEFIMTEEIEMLKRMKNGLAFSDKLYQEIEKISEEEHHKDFERREREELKLDEGIEALKNGDYKTALIMLRPLAEQGNHNAQYNLGVMHDNGWGVPKDDTEAVKWFREAAEQGNSGAQYNLGVMYANGQGVPKDDVEAVKWYREAAGQGDAGAQYNLGVMYANGQGVPKNFAEATKLFREAAGQGDAGAQDALEALIETEQKSKEMAEHNLKLMESKGEKSFKGSWKIFGGLSLMAIIGFLMLVGGKIGGGLINILFWGGLAAWYYKRKCR